MLTIRLQRIGKKHQPSYRLVVAERRSKMAAPPVEDLGSYNPASKAVTFKAERITYWIGKGAQPTVTTHNLLVEKGVVKSAKKLVKLNKPAAKAEAPAAAAAPAADAPAA